MWTTAEPSENQKLIDEFHPNLKTLLKFIQFWSPFENSSIFYCRGILFFDEVKAIYLTFDNLLIFYQ